MKKLGIILVLLLIVGFCVENIMLHPFRGSTFNILNISEAQISEIRINHYGETVSITDPEQVSTIVSMFQCQLERRGTDYIGHSNGIDWYVAFVSKLIHGFSLKRDYTAYSTLLSTFFIISCDCITM